MIIDDAATLVVETKGDTIEEEVKKLSFVSEYISTSKGPSQLIQYNNCATYL